MGKYLYFALFFLLGISSITLKGQNKYFRRSEPKFGYGVKAGLNISNQSTPNDDSGYEINNIVRYNAGGYCYYLFNKYVAVQPELLVSGKGVHWKDFYDDMKDLLTYLDIPLIIKYQPVKYVNIQAGPQVGLRLRAMQKNMKTGEKTNINDYYNFFDYGLAVGVEGNLPNHINLTVRYVFGLSSATTDVEYIDPWKNNFLQLSVGYRLTGK